MLDARGDGLQPRTPELGSRVLDAVLAVTDECLAVLASDGEVVRVSNALAVLLGVEPDRLIGRSVFEFVHASDLEIAAAFLNYRATVAGDQLSRSLRLCHAAGHWIGVQVTGTATESDGRPVALIQVAPTATDSATMHWRMRAISSEVVVRQAFALLGAKPSTLMAAVSDVVEQLGHFVVCNGAGVFIESPSGLELLSGWQLDAATLSKVGREVGPLPSFDVMLEKIRSQGFAIVDEDTTVPGLEWLAAAGVVSALLVPFRYRDGAGLMVMWRTDKRLWSDDAIRVARTCVALIGQALIRVDSDERFEQAFAEGPVGFAMLSWNGDVLDCNDRILEQFGSANGDRARMLDRLHPEDRLAIRYAVQALRECRETRTILTFRVIRIDGEVRVLRAHVSRIGDDSPRSCVFTLVEDITDYTRQRAELEASERSNRRIVESIPALVFRLDLDGRVTMAGREIENRGLPAEAMIGLAIADMVPEVAGTEFWNRLMECFQHGERFEEELSVSSPDGPLVFEVRAVPEVGPTGEVDSLLILALDVTDSRAMAARLAYTAVHDPLTGAANRDTLIDRLTRTINASPDQPIGLLFLDLDRFKVVNDSLGHAAGDELLRLVVRRLRSNLRAEDLVARVGGDEFVVLLPESGEDVAVELAERVRLAFEQPIHVHGADIRQTVSVGVAICDRADEVNLEDVLRRADRAMYEAKQRGRNRRELFDERMFDEMTARTTLEGELRVAILRDELVVHYQPEVDLSSRQVVGVEALLRWNHPSRGLLPAAEFIDVAEDTGLIHDLGRFVLRQATADLSGALAHIRRPLTVRINVSGREFVRGDLIGDLALALASSGIDPTSVCLEVTEHTIMGNPDLAASQIEEIRGLGVQLAIDDFGIGYSSFAQLKQFSVDAIKIDRSFVADLPGARDSRAIVGSILGLARALSLDVVAEGVETEEQARCLRLLGCERGQGFLFGRAIPISELVARIEESEPRLLP